jgi:hypothetical protein
LQRLHGRPLCRQFVPLPIGRRLQQWHRLHSLHYHQSPLCGGRDCRVELFHRNRRLPGSTVFTLHVSHNSWLRNYMEMQAALKISVAYSPVWVV